MFDFGYDEEEEQCIDSGQYGQASYSDDSQTSAQEPYASSAPEDVGATVPSSSWDTGGFCEGPTDGPGLEPGSIADWGRTADADGYGYLPEANSTESPWTSTEIEGEAAAPEAAGAATVTPSYDAGATDFDAGAGGSSGVGSVEVCHRDADGIPWEDTFHWQHYWLRTDHGEAGMHPQHGGSPGSSGGLLSDTAIDDHTGAGDSPGSTCESAENYAGFSVDPECVDQQLQPGRPTGKWVPVTNDCHAEVDRILDGCRVDPNVIDDGAGYE